MQIPSTAPFLLSPDDTRFPDVSLALKEPDGLLAIGGDLSPIRLLEAYRHGIFPWYSDEQPILWWSPNLRTILLPERLKVSRSLRKTLNKDYFHISFDQSFRQVMQQCAAPRKQEAGTWITAEMEDAYCRLHELGYAHSVETWHDNKLVGGLYGVAIGRIFCGESMFSKETDASKMALVHLVRQLQDWGYLLIDCQLHTTHLASLGAEEISRDRYLNYLKQGAIHQAPAGVWPKQVK